MTLSATSCESVGVDRLPQAAPRACGAQPCSRMAEYRGRCQVHAQANERMRGSAADRGYDTDWRRLRKAKLATDPICELRTRCIGMVATEVHHVISIRDRPDLRLEWSNLRSTCKPCHSALTRSGHS
jgi:5-methylcytosine-specific restriction protein A